MDAYRLSEKEVLQQVGSSMSGLSQLAIHQRQQKHGFNLLQESGGKKWWLMLFQEFTDVMVLMLIAAVIIAFLLGEHTDALFILIVVILNAVIGFIQEFKAEASLQALKKLISPEAKVIRNGKVQVVLAKELVPGDILVLEEGAKIPADSRLLEVTSLATDESALTGESVPRQKKVNAILKSDLAVADQDNMVFMGTVVVRGKGRAVVTSTGMETQFGKIATLTQELKEELSPLQKELNLSSKFIAKATMAICVVVFLVGILVGNDWLMMFLFAVALAVAAVPEGWPAIMTITLALGVQRMVRKNAIIRKLSSVETLGSTTVICSDKTGTLTKNEMTVTQLWVNDRLVQVEGSGYAPRGRFMFNGSAYKDETLRLLLEGASLCNDAILTSDGEMLGDPTEGALVVVAEKYGISVDKFRKGLKKRFEIPFDSSRKLMSVVYEYKGKLLVFVKGAPDRVVDICTRVKTGSRVSSFSSVRKKGVLSQNLSMAKGALRVLAVAYKELPLSTKSFKNLESGLVFLGLAGMLDPPRDEVRAAVGECKKAGIRIFVITGDHGITAKAIAMTLDMADESTRIVTGQELGRLHDDALRDILKGKAIFARASPEDKLRIVSALKDMGEIVAVTGDGVNDAPALKRADIGVAMGKSGTDVAKEASDMVLADDSFASIVAAVDEGRCIYANIKKFIQYIFACNIGEVWAVFLGILLFPQALILSAIQLLWMDMVTDVLPALALGVEPAEPDLMNRPPRNPKKRLITMKRFLDWSLAGLVMAISTLFVFFWYLDDLPKAQSMAFCILVLSQMVYAFNCRNKHKSLFSMNLFENIYLVGAVFISVLAQVLVIELPFFQEVFKTVGLSLEEWVVVALFSLAVLGFDEVRKYITGRMYRAAL